MERSEELMILAGIQWNRLEVVEIWRAAKNDLMGHDALLSDDNWVANSVRRLDVYGESGGV